MINIATLNVKGLATRKKLKETLTLLKTYTHIDIFALQETNITSEREEFAKQNWQLPSFWNQHTAFLFNNKNIQLISLNDDDTRSITISITLNNNKFTLNNVYFPLDR